VNTVELSKRISHTLRHDPASAGVTLDSRGALPLETLAKALRVSVAEVCRVAREDSKQRFIIEGDLIRAAQGHSFPVEGVLQIPEVIPEILYHGTKERFLKGIFEKGLIPNGRQYVHLSGDRATAEIVAKRRRGASVILEITTRTLREAGHVIGQAANGVWLTDHVPVEHFTIPE